MPCFLINFCGVWNPLGAISHFSKHPGSFWGSGARRRRAAGGQGLKFPFLLKADRGDLKRESGAAGPLSVQSDSKEKECQGSRGGNTRLAAKELYFLQWHRFFQADRCHNHFVCLAAKTKNENTEILLNWKQRKYIKWYNLHITE